MSNFSPLSRFLLWVDGVGSFWVCQSARIRLGQAVPDSTVEVPLLADISRHHATIHRDGEGYLIEPVREVYVDGTKIDRPIWLSSGAVIELGRTVRLQFCKPHPLSASARLDFLSNHHTQPSTKAAVLMAETCVLGPAARNHVVCRHWTRDVVLHRLDETFYCRTEGPFEVGPSRYESRGPIDMGAQVTGEQFSFSLEAV